MAAEQIPGQGPSSTPDAKPELGLLTTLDQVQAFCAKQFPKLGLVVEKTTIDYRVMIPHPTSSEVPLLTTLDRVKAALHDRGVTVQPAVVTFSKGKGLFRAGTTEGYGFYFKF